MMAETNDLAERYQISRSAAAEAIDALLSAYWSDSFETDLLEERLAETIQFFTRNAVYLTEAYFESEPLEEGDRALQLSPTLVLDGADQPSPIASQKPEQALIDLRDRPSPEILRLLAIGSPQVVNVCVMTLFQLGYARPEEWSRQLPTVNPGEVMRILTKRIMFPGLE